LNAIILLTLLDPLYYDECMML